MLSSAAFFSYNQRPVVVDVVAMYGHDYATGSSMIRIASQSLTSVTRRLGDLFWTFG